MTVYDEDIVERIEQANGIAPSELAERLGISQRTLRDHIRRINQTLDGAARIQYMRTLGGYVLEVSNRQAFDAWLERRRSLLRDDPASSADARAAYLLNDLLLRSDWITLDALAEILYVSRACISNDLKRIAPVLDRYSLTLEKRPRYGIRVKGPEMGRRLCLAEATVRRMEGSAEDAFAGAGVSVGAGAGAGAGMLADADEGAENGAASKGTSPDDVSPKGTSPDEVSSDGDRFDRTLAPLVNAVSSCVDRVLAHEDFSVNSLSYQNLLVHIAIAVLRIQGGNYMPADSLPNVAADSREYEVAQRIARCVSETLGVELPASEVGYIAIHLAGKRVLYDDQESQVVTDDMWELAGRMIDVVWNTYRFDFRDDVELRMNLARHLAPLSIRLTYHMHLENPLLDDIKSRFPLAYAMAGEASTELANAYGYYPSEHELGYIAMTFALALERQKTEQDKIRVLVVCASGMASARLLAYKIQREFGEHLASVETCNVTQVASQNFDAVDYVFTTVPLNVSVPVPVREITLLLTDDDRALMRDVIEGSSQDDPAAYLPRNLFFAHEHFESKQEAIAVLVARMREACPDEIPENFEELVWQREEAAPTSFGNLVALPHPLFAVSTMTLVAVALLDEPIEWGTETGPVQAIFLMSFSRLPETRLDGFYRPVASLLNDGAAIEELLRTQRYEQLIGELRKR